jgi:hypothetical protein
MAPKFVPGSQKAPPLRKSKVVEGLDKEAQTVRGESEEATI